VADAITLALEADITCSTAYAAFAILGTGKAVLALVTHIIVARLRTAHIVFLVTYGSLSTGVPGMATSLICLVTDLTAVAVQAVIGAVGRRTDLAGAIHTGLRPIAVHTVVTISIV
jgi:hypothetical protein